MENHCHTVLRTRPDIVATWSNREVAMRWLRLYTHRGSLTSAEALPGGRQITALAECTERIAELRKRLSSLSWFMGRLNEFIARAANIEDKVKGRFWESRFKCTALLDEAAIAACMVYVDLNPIRAGLASMPEDSDFTSIRERIHAWRMETRTEDSTMNGQNTRSDSLNNESLEKEVTRSNATSPKSLKTSSLCWLCPIQSKFECRGILEMTEEEYMDLVDRSGRILRAGKRGAIDADLAPILLRISANPEAWMDTISHFERRFRLAAGMLVNLRRFAERIGNHWFTGVSASRIAFAAKPQSA
jgi:hypothetical protein